MKATVAEAVEVGTQLPSLSVRFTRERLVRYAGASTDFNPIHYSEYFAAHAGLPGVIAQGMLTMGTALRVVTNWVGDPAGSPPTSRGSPGQWSCPMTLTGLRWNSAPASQRSTDRW